jgi:hypothetical protein
MSGLKRFQLKVILRSYQPETDREGPEGSCMYYQEAATEFEARRKVLESVWVTGRLVSYFDRVREATI